MGLDSFLILGVFEKRTMVLEYFSSVSSEEQHSVPLNAVIFVKFKKVTEHVTKQEE